MKLIIASNNQHKIREIREILGNRFEEILSLREAGIDHETVEDADSFLGNAEKKAREICTLSGLPSLADDSGLCVDALGGAPGIYSARFCGRHGDDAANNALLLEKLAGVENRAAHFTSAVVLCYPSGEMLSAEGFVYGSILTSPRGKSGFGYDPIFLPDGFDRSVSEMTEEEKNSISHRGNALRALLAKMT